MKQLSARTWFLVVAGAVILLQAIDGALTTALLNTGWAYETNPFVVGMADHSMFWLLKLGISALVLGILYKRIKGSEYNYRRCTKGLAVVGIIYTGIVAWNAYCLYTVQVVWAGL